PVLLKPYASCLNFVFHLVFLVNDKSHSLADRITKRLVNNKTFHAVLNRYVIVGAFWERAFNDKRRYDASNVGREENVGQLCPLLVPLSGPQPSCSPAPWYESPVLNSFSVLGLTF